jgi:hypothetical protein
LTCECDIAEMRPRRSRNMRLPAQIFSAFFLVALRLGLGRDGATIMEVRASQRSYARFYIYQPTSLRRR